MASAERRKPAACEHTIAQCSGCTLGNKVMWHFTDANVGAAALKDSTVPTQAWPDSALSASLGISLARQGDVSAGGCRERFA